MLISLLCLNACNKEGHKLNPDPGGLVPPTTEEENLIGNWRMEDDVNLELTDTPEEGNWRYIGGWCEYNCTPMQIDGRGYKDSRCLVLSAEDKTCDVGFAQVIKGLVPGKHYKVTARIKTEGVTGAGTAGAHVSLNYLWAPMSEGVMGTKDWTKVTLEFDATSDTETICLKLGSTTADVKGTAYFDNVVLSENHDLYIRNSKHLELVIDKKSVPVSDQIIDNWLANLDKMYESYAELFGWTPYSGRTIQIRAANIGAWAYAGNPIQWNKDYISSTLTTVGKGDWCFGLMHELGHDYNPGHFEYENSYFVPTQAWNFNEEVFANFRMYYGLTHVEGATVITDASVPDGMGKYEDKTMTFKGGEIKRMYKEYTSNCYDRTIGANVVAEMGNAICYCLCRIVDDYPWGWDAFKGAWEELYHTQKIAGEDNWTRWQKFDYLLTILDKHTPNGISVRDTFTTHELTIIEKQLTTEK